MTNARFAAALANPTPRTIAGVDPIVSHSAAPGYWTSGQIVGGTVHTADQGNIRLIYGHGRVYFSTTYTIDQFHRDGINPTSSGPFGAEVVYNGRKIEFAFKGGGQVLHVFADEVLTSLAGYTDVPGDTGYRNWLIDFGTAATRRIRVVSATAGTDGFAGLVTEPGYTLSDPTPTRPCNMLIVGDSFVETTGASTPILGFPALLSEALGVTNMIQAGSGGTGFLQTNGARVNFRDRIDADLTLSPMDDPQLDVIAIFASGNDSSQITPNGTQPTPNATYEAAVDYCFQKARAAWPNATILGVGPYFKEAGQAGYYGNLASYMESTVQDACEAHGCTFVPGLPAAIAALSSGTLNSYYDETGHWNNAGHAWGAATIAALITEAVGATESTPAPAPGVWIVTSPTGAVWTIIPPAMGQWGTVD